VDLQEKKKHRREIVLIAATSVLAAIVFGRREKRERADKRVLKKIYNIT